MGRFADQRDAAACERIRGLDGKGKDAATRLDAHPAEERMGAAFDLG